MSSRSRLCCIHNASALAYAALFDAEQVTSVLVYPLRAEAWSRAAERGRDVLQADAGTGGRAVRLALAGLPFGWTADGDSVRQAWGILAAG